MRRRGMLKFVLSYCEVDLNVLLRICGRILWATSILVDSIAALTGYISIILSDDFRLPR